VYKRPQASLRGAGHAAVHLHVFNYGCLVELATFRAGRGIRVGPGDYMATAVLDGRPVAQLLTVRAGARTDFLLDSSRSEKSRLGWLEKPFRLHVPLPPPGPAKAAEAGQADSLRDCTHELAVVRHDLERARLCKCDPALLGRVVARARDPQALLAALDLAAPHVGAWATLLDHASGDTFRVTCDLLKEMDDKDFFEADTAGGRTAVREALRVRAWRAQLEGVIPDTIWDRFVLSRESTSSPPDFGLWTALPWRSDPDSASGPAILACGRAGCDRAGRSRLGHVATPANPGPAAAPPCAPPGSRWSGCCGATAFPRGLTRKGVSPKPGSAASGSRPILSTRGRGTNGPARPRRPSRPLRRWPSVFSITAGPCRKPSGARTSA